MTPGELVARLASLEVEIEEWTAEVGSVAIEKYYEGQPRPTGIARLAGRGEMGSGECVAWTPREQEAFAAACERLELPRSATLEDVSAFLVEALADPYHRAAVEAAAIDLALHQAGANLFGLAGRPPAPVAFCRSIGRERDPLGALEAILDQCPDARLKIDVPPAGWTAATWDKLARTGRVVVVDFKRESALDQVHLAHAFLPDAWLEDPPVEAITLDRDGAWRRRVSLDGYVLAAVDLEDPEIPPAAVNVKAPRVGGWLEALRCLEECRRRGLHAYVGGMFEVDVGRPQARVLASLYTADAWNDIAPLSDDSDGSLPASPLEATDDFTGFAPRPTPPRR